jgi:predicted  nucleic acid-binding Zn-ribbon protein
MKIPFFRVSTFFTVVLVYLFTSLLTYNNSWATEPTSAPGYYKKSCEELYLGKKVEIDECYAREKEYSTTSNRCDEAKTKFTEAKSRFGGDAGTAELALKCLKCKGKNPPSYCEGSSSAGYSRAKSSWMKTTAGAGATTAGAKTSEARIAQARSCPTVAEELADEVKEKIEKYEDQVSNLKDRIETLQQEVSEATTAIRSAEAKYSKEDVPAFDKKKEEAVKRFEKEQKELKENFDREYQALTNEINKIVAEMQELEFQKNTSLMAIQKECRDTARARVSEELKVRREKYMSNTLSYGSLSQHFNNVGRPLMQKSSDKAVEYYNFCLRQSADRFQSIADDYARRKEQFAVNINSIKDQQSKIIQKIGGPEMQKEVQAMLQEIFNEHKSALEKAYAEYTNEVQKQTETLQQKQKKLQELQTELQQREDNLAHEVKVLAMTDEVVSKNPNDSDSGVSFLDNFAAYNAAATSMYYACECEQTKDATFSGSVTTNSNGASKISKMQCDDAMKAICNTETENVGNCTNPNDKLVNKLRRESIR